MSALPPFLRPFQQDVVVLEPCVNAVFPHDKLDASAHAFWWPSHVDIPPAVLLFIPGNPGLVEFYTPFLAALHEKSGGRLSILAHGHLGHSPAVPHGGAYKDPYSVGLTAQVESALEAVDAIKAAFPQSAIAVAGHSVGAWITLQVMKARPDTIASVFLLFPTIAHIAKTPNGHSLSWVFRSPLPRLISYASVLTRALPLRVLAMLFPDWPHTQVLVLRTLLHARSAVYASLSLAHEEMVTIRDLDATLLQEYSRRLHFYFAKSDGWVGQQKEDILKAFDAGSSSVKIVHGQADIPHSFCINHGEQLAQQCFEWLLSARLL